MEEYEKGKHDQLNILLNVFFGYLFIPLENTNRIFLPLAYCHA